MPCKIYWDEICCEVADHTLIASATPKLSWPLMLMVIFTKGHSPAIFALTQLKKCVVQFIREQSPLLSGSPCLNLVAPKRKPRGHTSLSFIVFVSFLAPAAGHFWFQLLKIFCLTMHQIFLMCALQTSFSTGSTTTYLLLKYKLEQKLTITFIPVFVRNCVAA